MSAVEDLNTRMQATPSGRACLLVISKLLLALRKLKDWARYLLLVLLGWTSNNLPASLEFSVLFKTKDRSYRFRLGCGCELEHGGPIVVAASTPQDVKSIVSVPQQQTQAVPVPETVQAIKPAASAPAVRRGPPAPPAPEFGTPVARSVLLQLPSQRVRLHFFSFCVYALHDF
jgi:hypothetical protein